MHTSTSHRNSSMERQNQDHGPADGRASVRLPTRHRIGEGGPQDGPLRDPSHYFHPMQMLRDNTSPRPFADSLFPGSLAELLHRCSLGLAREAMKLQSG